MAKVLYSATMSLDGFIAGPGGDMQWMLPYLGGANPTADALVDQIGALLVGRRTFGGDDPHRGTDKEGALEGAWHGPQFVLTHRPPATEPPDTTFVTDLKTALSAARKAAADKYVNILGADVAAQALAAGEVDEILVFIAPVLLGDGVPLFRHPGGTQLRLERRLQAEHPLAAALWYSII
jgi:dihydrofolate reductase